MGGTLDNCRLLELDERCNNSDDEIDSDKAALESLICWNLVKAALVRLVAASTEARSFEGRKLFRSFLRSSIFKKSEMLSSSVGIEPELSPPSASMPEPGCAADELRLVFPLLLSSSVLLPPVESLALRCPKLLVYLGAWAGRGEVEPGSDTAGILGELLEGSEPCGLEVAGALASANALRAEALPTEAGRLAEVG